MKKTLAELIKAGKRIDERGGVKDYRDIKINFNVSKNAEGSAEVRIGKTWVIAGVKIDLGDPFKDSPDEGILIVNAEFLPLAYSEFEAGPPGIDAIELARVVDRGIRESEFIDMKKLCLEKGKKVYSVFIDIYVMNYDGNLIDASFLAAIAALKKAFLPKVEKVEDSYRVVYGEKTKQKLPLSERVPFMCTVYKLGNSLFLDANLIEEKAADARISLAFSFKGNSLIHAIQKSGPAVFSFNELKEALKMAEEGAKFLMKKFLTYVK